MDDTGNFDLTMTSSKVISEEETTWCLRVLLSPATAAEGRRFPLEPLTIGRTQSGDKDVVLTKKRLTIADGRISRAHATIKFDDSTGKAVIVDRGSKNGTWVNGSRVNGKTTISLQDIIRLGDTIFVCCQLVWPAIESSEETAGIAGDSAALHEIRKRVVQLAPTYHSVLITGESGTGKELVARGLHDLSGRTGPFTAVNTSAIPRDLVESELFGVKKGAFSGADRDRTGLLVRAHKGTLFLDEIGDMPAGAQAKLLRALEELQVTPLGASEPTKVDVRVVAATNADVDEALADGIFRTDLFHRLARMEIKTPSLRERREDILVLWNHFLAREGAPGRMLNANLAEALLLWPWLGNVRELRNVAGQFAVQLESKPKGHFGLLPHKITDHFQRVRAGQESPHCPAGALSTAKHNIPLSSLADDPPAEYVPHGERPSREALLESLKRHQGNLAAVAADFGRKRPQAYRWLTHYGIDADEFRLTE